MSGGVRRILHIGQRKTGTTWLQYGAQRAAEAGRIAFEQWAIAKWSRDVKWKNATDADYARLAEALPLDKTDGTVFASCEGLIVHDPARLAATVLSRWPDATLLVTTRAPQDYLMSSFNNNSMGEGGSAADFAVRFARSHMRRSHDLDGVAEAFGRERVRFLPYELLRDDREGYLDRLEALFGAEMRAFFPQEKLNASPPVAYLILAREVNRMIEERAPEVFETAEWRNFMRMANFSAGVAKGLDTYFADFLRGGYLPSDAIPLLDAETEKRLAARMTVLADLPDYRPYLPRYGLALAA